MEESDRWTAVMCHRVQSHAMPTFFNDAAPVVQHALHLTAPHVRQTRLLHKVLAPVEACAVGQVGPHRDQKANVVLPQPCMVGGRVGERRKERQVRKRERGVGG